MALMGKTELVEQLQTSADNMQRVRKRKEAQREIASKQESEPPPTPTLDVTKRRALLNTIKGCNASGL